MVVKLLVANACATLTLERPPANAINSEWLDAFECVLGDLEHRADVAVLHIRSAHRHFCAGADLKLMSASLESAAGVDVMMAVVERMQRAFARLEALPQVTLAEINGAALGGGFELALACDLRIAAHEAPIGLPEAKLGLLPAAGGTQRLAALCGLPLAKRLILGAETVTGVEAERLGLVQWSAPAAHLQRTAADIASRIAASAPRALAACKRCIAAARPGDRTGHLLELIETRRLYGDGQTRELVQQFISKRKPE